MANVQLNPYIFFTGNCREAMEFYKEVFGGELTLQTYDEVPGEKPENSAGKVMHSSLNGGVVRLMASDSTAHDKFEQSFISLSLGGTDEERLRGIFEKLSEGATVTQELKKEFWGGLFGSLTDKFGVEWMVNIEQAPAEQTAEQA